MISKQVLSSYWRIVLLSFVIITYSNLFGHTTSIPVTIDWDFYHARNEHAPIGFANWNDPFYEHSRLHGNAQLGYADGKETTVVDSTANTIYLRQEFGIDDSTQYENSDFSFDLEFSGFESLQVQIIRGPYLNSGSANGIVVRWRTDMPTESILNYGTTLDSLFHEVNNITLKTEHELMITGLQPNTRYYYSIRDSSQILAEAAEDLYFKTAPETGSTQPITSWILGDCGTASLEQRNVRDAYYDYIGSDHTDMILFLGDNAYSYGTDDEYQYALFENMYEDKLENTVAWSCMGNREGYSANSSDQSGPYYDIFTFPTNGESGGLPSGTEAYYSFDYGNIHFIVLESTEINRGIDGDMYYWCQNDIQSTEQDWIVALCHHPPYSKGAHDSDEEIEMIEMRENFFPMLENQGVDLVLSGHSHSYERSYFLNGHYDNSSYYNSNIHTIGPNGHGDGRIDGDGAYIKTLEGNQSMKGTVYVVTGSAGLVQNVDQHPAMYTRLSELGSTVLEVDSNILNVKFITATGEIHDYFSIKKVPISCGVELSPGDPCDDNNPCTLNELYNLNCDCIPQDTIEVESGTIDGEILVEQGDTTTYDVLNSNVGSFNWEVTGGSILSGEGTSSVVIVWTDEGQASLCVSGVNGECFGQSVCANVQVIVSTGTEINTGVASLKIYPNPALDVKAWGTTLLGFPPVSNSGVAAPRVD